MEKAKGKRGRFAGKGKQRAVTAGDTPSVKELGITRNQSSQWQQLAGVPDEEMRKRLPMETGRRTSIKKIIKDSRPAKPKPDPAALRLQRVRTLALRVWGAMFHFTEVIEDVPLQEVVAPAAEMGRRCGRCQKPRKRDSQS